MKLNYLRLVKMLSKFTLYGILLQACFYTFLLAGNSSAQNKSVREVYIDVNGSYGSVEEVFRSIENQTDFEFAYSVRNINRKGPIQLTSGKRAVREVLLEVSRTHGLKFKQVNNSISVNKLTGNEINIEVILDGIKVTGIVKSSEDGSGLPGINVIVKGTSLGTVTDVEGNYSLDVPDENSILVFSSVGYVQEEVLVGSRTTINISLVPDITALEEIVVVGYGSIKKSDLTGSLVSVNSKDFDKQPLTRIDQALQGRTAGVTVTQTSGTPGASYKIRIRGANSINGSNEPLYVVDGLVIGNISSINVNDIKSLEVLKDASATAIYGSRGANGVVLITTKTGSKKDTPEFNFESFMGVSNVTQELDMMTAAEFAEGVNFMENKEFYTPEEIAALRRNGGEDWHDRLFRQGSFSNYQLSLNGGTDAVSYYFSGNYYDSKGTIINNDYKRYGLRANINARLSDNIDIGLNSYLSREENTGERADIGKGLSWDPTTPAFDEEGNYNFTTLKEEGVGNGWTNPLVGPENNVKEDLSNRVLANGFFNYNILPGLVLNISGGIEKQAKVENDYKSILLDNVGEAKVRNAENTRYQNTNRLTYRYEPNSNRRLQIDAVHEQQYVSRVWTESRSEGFFSDNTTYKNLALGAIQRNSNQSVSESLQSFLGRANYTFMDKYLITASVRADGSSKFQGDRRWGVFPSGSVAWRLSEEPFLQNLVFVDNLKLRVSHGVTGSQAIGPLATRSKPIVGTHINYPFSGQAFTIGVAPSNRKANPDLTWETTTQTNIGFDLGLWESKFTLAVDLYKKNTTDLLLDVFLPEFVGPTVMAQNIGEVENKGFDISLGLTVVDQGDWNISSTLSVSKNLNEVISLVNDEPVEKGNEYISGVPVHPTRVEVGQPISSFRGYVFEGVYQLGQEDEAALYGRAPGDARYKDINGDTVITTDDIVIIGDGNPDLTWGWNWNVSWKNFELSMLMLGSHGNDIYNFQRGRMMSLGAVQYHATHADYNDRWTEDNPSSIPSGRDGTQLLSSQFLEDGSYVTMKNISLHYTFKNVLSSIGLDALRLYASAENLFIITNYSGFDPEATASGNSDVDLGIDFNTYPLSRSFSIGLNVTF